MSKTLLHGINYIKTLDQWSSTFLAPWTIFSTRSLLVLRTYHTSNLG